MAITLRQLSYFLALAETRNFGFAAARVHVTQPALSMQIRDLEEELGISLIERLPRGLHLTPEGREFHDRAKRIMAEVTELESSARRKAIQGRVHIGVIPTVAPYLLPRVLPRLRQDDRVRDLRIREARTDDLMAELDNGRLDAIVIAEPAAGQGLAVAPLFEDRFLLAGTPERIRHAARGMEALRPLSIDPDQLLLLDEGHCLADQALEICGLTRQRLRLDLGAASLSTLCGMVGQGLGLTLLPELAIATETAAMPEMAVRRFETPEPARQIVLARRATTDGDGWFAALREVLQDVGGVMVAAARSEAVT